MEQLLYSFTERPGHAPLLPFPALLWDEDEYFMVDTLEAMILKILDEMSADLNHILTFRHLRGFEDHILGINLG